MYVCTYIISTDVHTYINPYHSSHSDMYMMLIVKQFAPHLPFWLSRVLVTHNGDSVYRTTTFKVFPKLFCSGTVVHLQKEAPINEKAMSDMNTV